MVQVLDRGVMLVSEENDDDKLNVKKQIESPEMAV